MFAALDPGVGGTGIALFEESSVAPVHHLTIHRPRAHSWQAKAQGMMHKLGSFLVTYEPTTLYIEEPLFISTAGGRAVAGRGDLVKLTLLAGACWGVAREHGVRVEFVPVRNWKGQLPKKVIEERIRYILGGKYEDLILPDHEWDAIGIGLFLKGILVDGKEVNRGKESGSQEEEE